MHHCEDLPMNDHTIGLVKEGFDLVEPIAPQAAALFYANLVEEEPSLQRLFMGDMAAQGAKLMQMVSLAVGTLDSSLSLTPTLQNFGRRLASLGFQDQYYETAGSALLKTLRECLGVAYTPDFEESLTDVYGEVVATMKETGHVPAHA
jgi:hemoglobin-like flavoprotein